MNDVLQIMTTTSICEQRMHQDPSPTEQNTTRQ